MTTSKLQLKRDKNRVKRRKKYMKKVEHHYMKRKEPRMNITIEEELETTQEIMVYV